MEGWVGALIIGLIAGWLAGMVMEGGGFGVMGDIVVGIVGSMVGRWLFDAIGLEVYGPIGSLAMALAGAVAFLSLVRLVKRI